MSMVVRTNSMAMSANSALNKNNSSVAGNLQKLSTGFRINRAADDASGLAVSEKMKAQIKALDQAGKNAQDGASLIKTAEGYMGEIHDMLNRIVELAEKSANGTFETNKADGTTQSVTEEAFGHAGVDRQAIQDEVNQLTAEIDRIAETANFNGLKLLNGDLAASAEVPAGQDTPGTSLTGMYKLVGNNYVPQSGTADADSNNVYVTLQETAVTGDFATGNDAPTYYEKVTTGSGADETVTYNKVTEKETGDHTYVTLTATPQTVKGPVAGDAAIPAKDGLVLQIGETSTKSDKLAVAIDSFKTADLFADIASYENADSDSFTITQTNAESKTTGGLTIDVSNQKTAAASAEAVRRTINTVSSRRAELGAMENRLDYTMNNLDTASQNITDANSRIRDTDMAKTMMQYTQGNTLTQAAQAMLAQANQAPSQVLQLLQ